MSWWVLFGSQGKHQLFPLITLSLYRFNWDNIGFCEAGNEFSNTGWILAFEFIDHFLFHHKFQSKGVNVFKTRLALRYLLIKKVCITQCTLCVKSPRYNLKILYFCYCCLQIILHAQYTLLLVSTSVPKVTLFGPVFHYLSPFNRNIQKTFTTPAIMLLRKGRGKLHPITGYEGLEVW